MFYQLENAWLTYVTEIETKQNKIKQHEQKKQKQKEQKTPENIR